MNRAFLAALLGITLLFTGACKSTSKPSDKDAIRTGVINYLVSLKTLNVNAMDVNVTQSTINGNQAQAQVEIRLKNSPPDGASMKLAYTLEKRGDEWAVVKSEPAGGSMQHPAPGTMPPGGMPGAMPPGHPNVNGSAGQAPTGHPDFSSILKSAQPPATQAPAASSSSSSTNTSKP